MGDLAGDGYWCRSTGTEAWSMSDSVQAESARLALDYMGLQPQQPIAGIKLDRIFIGSCTNARIEDLRAAAAVIGNGRVANNIKQALVVPGSGLVKARSRGERRRFLSTLDLSGGLQAVRCVWV